MNEGLKHLTGLWRWIPKELTGCTIDLRQLDRAGEKRKKKRSGWAKSKYQWRPDLEFQTRKRSSLAGEILQLHSLTIYSGKSSGKLRFKIKPKKRSFWKVLLIDPLKPWKLPFGLEKWPLRPEPGLIEELLTKGRRQDEQENSRRRMERPETRDRKKTSIFF